MDSHEAIQCPQCEEIAAKASTLQQIVVEHKSFRVPRQQLCLRPKLVSQQRLSQVNTLSL